MATARSTTNSDIHSQLNGYVTDYLTKHMYDANTSWPLRKTIRLPKQAAQRPALLEQLRPCHTVDAAIHAASAQQGFLRCVDDGIHAHFRDVFANNDKGHIMYRLHSNDFSEYCSRIHSVLQWTLGHLPKPTRWEIYSNVAGSEILQATARTAPLFRPVSRCVDSFGEG